MYLAYSRRHSNPHFGGDAASAAEECQVIVHAADCASQRHGGNFSDDSIASAGSASLEVSSDWEAELLVAAGAAEHASWATGRQQMPQLQVLTLIPNACYNC